MKKLILISLGLLLIVSCKKEVSEPQQETFQVFEVPDYFPTPEYDFSSNPITKEGFELGRKLFYDPRLSVDGTVSCGTCHAQVHAFADHGLALSHGIENKAGKRNAPGIYNLAWLPELMWDGGIHHIELMPLAPLTDTSEMAFPLEALLTYLNTETEYPEEFNKVFGTTEITSYELLRAITQFQGSIVSHRSKYDQYLQGKATLSSDEMEGMELFNSKCSSCHAGGLQSDFSYRNNGLDISSDDPGRGRITLRQSDMGKFRVPSLRNVRLTNPYMHDGRFPSLQAVLDHYDSGVHPHPNLDPSLENGIPMSEEEKDRIIAFLKTLSDFELLSDSRFSEPPN